MNEHLEKSDETLHELLKARGAEWRLNMRLDPKLHQDCLAMMESGRAQGRRLRSWGRRMLVSSMGLAAAIALIVTLAFPLGGNTPVAAKTILTRLAEQVQGDGVLSVTFNNVRVDEITIDGHVQIGTDSIAGDLNVSIEEEADKPILVDASLAVTAEKGWVLLRRLEIPEPEAQAIIQLFVGPNAPALILLPDGILKNMELMGEEAPLTEIRRLATGQMAAIVREVVHSGADLGAVVTRHPDGVTQVTLRVKNAETLKKLIEMAAAATGQSVEDGVDISDDDANEIIGCTLAVTFDEQTQSVKSFSFTDIADMQGMITIALLEGAIDPALLDSARVATPATRTIDIGFLKGIIETAIGNEE